MLPTQNRNSEFIEQNLTFDHNFNESSPKISHTEFLEENQPNYTILSPTKIYEDLDSALSGIYNGCRIMIGGFGMCGVPENLIRGLLQKQISNLHIIAGTGGSDDYGPGLLVKHKLASIVDTTFIGSRELNRQYFNGEIELNIVPQGDFTEKVRAARAGIPALFTSTGVGTILEIGQVPVKYSLGGESVEKYSEVPEVKHFDGEKFLMIKSYKADFSLIKAWKADSKGNLVFRSTARNFNALMAGASKITIAEVEEIVEDGELTPDMIHVPGIYVNRVIKGSSYEKRIGVLAVKTENNVEIFQDNLSKERLEKRLRIAKRAAKEIKPGMSVNLGLGIPTIVSNYVDENYGVLLHGENGVLGMSSFPSREKIDPDSMNPSRQPITLSIGGSVFSSDMSFDIIRGGHIDVTMLGACQVSRHGDISNWIIPGKRAFGMGGAMELTKNCKKCIVCMEHVAGETLKIMDECNLPLTGQKCVDMIITDLGVFEVNEENGLTLVEIAEKVSLEFLRSQTACEFAVAEDLKLMQQ